MRCFFLQKKYFAYSDILIKMINFFKKTKAFQRSLKTCLVLNCNPCSNPPQRLNQPLKPDFLLFQPYVTAQLIPP